MDDGLKKYESMIIISLKAGEENVKALVEKFKALISEKASLEDVNEWGKRKLAYSINYEEEGYYVLFNFASAPSFTSELMRVYGITEGLLRSLIVAKSA